MACQKCESEKLLTVTAKCSDCCYLAFGEENSCGYVPNGLNIGSDDYVEFVVCLSCGQIQGDFPIVEERIQELDEEMKRYGS